MSRPLQIAGLFTNVDLHSGLSLNLIEAELALAINPGQFEKVILFDQADGFVDPNTGDRKERDGRPINSYATGWNGIDALDADHAFSQGKWRTTGIARLQPTAMPRDQVEQLLDKANQNPDSYHNSLSNTHLRTNLEQYKDQDVYADINLGISTEFKILEEMQTGSPVAVDYLMERAYYEYYNRSKPDVVLFSNHGGSFSSGGNFDGPHFDIDVDNRSIQVVELKSSLKAAIENYSDTHQKFGLIAYDECNMANIETVTELQETTRYFLGSQKTIPGNGYDYFRTLSSFKLQSALATQDQIELASRDLGLAFVNTYSARNGPNETLALIDTNHLDQLNTAVRRYADAFLAASDGFLADLLESINREGTRYEPWLQDLGVLALITRSMSDAPVALVDASTSILEALELVVVDTNQKYRAANGYMQGANSGLTITLPTCLKDEDIDYTSFRFEQRAPGFESQTGWTRVLAKAKTIYSQIQTNTGLNPSRAEIWRQEDAGPLTVADPGDEARIALKVNGYLSRRSTDPQISSDRYTIPDIAEALLADLSIYLDVLNLSQRGSIDVSIVSATGQLKANWQQKVDQVDLIQIEGSLLPQQSANQKIQAGDQILLAALDSLVAFGYDLDIKLANQKLSPLTQDGTWGSAALIEEDAFIVNTLVLDGKSQEICFETPRSPGGTSGFNASIVLYSGAQGTVAVAIDKILEDGTREHLLSFSSEDYIEESILLDPVSQYAFTVSYAAAVGNEPVQATADVTLMVDTDFSGASLLKDALISQSLDLANWGRTTLTPLLNGKAPIVSLSSKGRLFNPYQLNEARAVDANYGVDFFDASSVLQAGKAGGTQTFASGLWHSSLDMTMEVFLQGTSRKNAQFGLFKVDDLTGAIQTDAGLVQPSNTQDYLEAALANLTAPLASLTGFQKEAVFVSPFKRDEIYAALLLTEEINGKQQAMYSLASANPGQSVQMLAFDRGFYGFEDLVKSSTSSWDGDFNDVTFYLA